MVVAVGNDVRCVFRLLRTPDCGRNVVADMQEAIDPWKCQIWRLLFLVDCCFGSACELVWRFLTSEGVLAYISTLLESGPGHI